MRILQIHCAYQNSGGEEVVVETERRVLQQFGHEVKQLIKRNDSIRDFDFYEKIKLAVNTVWSRKSFNEVKNALSSFKPNVVHIHNNFPLWSPSIYDACEQENIKFFQTVHNFRFMCINGLFYRNGKICQDCSKKNFPINGIIHGCYRNNKVISCVASMSNGFNNLRNFKTRPNLRFIALSEFSRSKMIENGFEKENVLVKPNFLEGTYHLGKHHEKYALFVGRLSAEKGMDALIKIIEEVNGRINFKIVGDGPYLDTLRSRSFKSVEIMGKKSREEIVQLMSDSRVLIFTSSWYENCPMVLLEALAVGLPVIAPNLGAIPEIIVNGEQGFLYEPGNTAAAVIALQTAFQTLSPLEYQKLCSRAQDQFIKKYSGDVGIEKLIDIYQT